MLKIECSNAQAKMITQAMQTFTKEIKFYYDLKDTFESMYAAAGQPITFGPKGYKFSKKTECDYILLENLRPKGYKNADRLEGLDMKHVKNVLEKLAQFHAAGAVYYTTHEVDACLKLGLYSDENRKFLEKLSEHVLPQMMEAMKQYSNAHEYVHKLEGGSSKNFDVMKKAHLVKENEFNVLNHGDMWTNNIMFQYDAEGNIANTLLIDYQLLKYGNPAQDLYYFLISSPSFDIKLDKFDYFIRYYHENLIKYLQLLNYSKKMPTLRELHCDLLNYGVWGRFNI